MASLGDSFPSNFKRAYSESSVACGTVILLDDIEAGKKKYHMIVGFDDDKMLVASVRINSEMNTNFYNRPELVELCHELSAEEIEFLDHDSLVACDKLSEWNKPVLVELINANPNYLLGRVALDTLEIIQYKISTAYTISPKIKKKFGLFIK